AGASAEAQVMQARAALIEPTAVLRLLVGAYQDPGADADAVDNLVRLDQRLHPEEVAEPLPERDAHRVADGELDVRDAVDVDGHRSGFAHPLASCKPVRPRAPTIWVESSRGAARAGPWARTSPSARFGKRHRRRPR